LAAWKRSLPEVRPKFIIAERVENAKLIKALGRAQHGSDGNGDIDEDIKKQGNTECDPLRIIRQSFVLFGIISQHGLITHNNENGHQTNDVNKLCNGHHRSFWNVSG
jgi:hypothetical protein